MKHHYTLIWLKFKSKGTTENWNSHILLVGLQNSIATLENNIENCYKVKRSYLYLLCDPAI